MDRIFICFLINQLIHVYQLSHCYNLLFNELKDFPDPEFFDACRHLSQIVDRGNITVFLAKLYAEQMIASKVESAQTLTASLPDNVPDLMLHYINELNRDVHKDKLEDLYRDEGEEYEREHGPQHQSRVTTGRDSYESEARARRAMRMRGNRLPLP
jgi:hypothetical protein